MGLPRNARHAIGPCRIENAFGTRGWVWLSVRLGTKVGLGKHLLETKQKHLFGENALEK
jgi:hypothetical protein